MHHKDRGKKHEREANARADEERDEGMIAWRGAIIGWYAGGSPTVAAIPIQVCD